MTAAIPATTAFPVARSTTSSATYLPALALVRFLAVAGVIWTHACGEIRWMGTGFDFADAGRFGSAFFTQCSVFLVMLKAFSRDDLTWLENARGRFMRVYLPFLLWSLIYAGNFDVKFYILHEGEPFEWDRSFLWNGSTYHLWFLPFIFLAGLALFGLGRWLMQAPKLAIPVALLLVFLGAWAGGIYLPVAPDSFERDYMFRLSWNRLPSVCWAAAFAIIYQFGARDALRTRGILILGITLFISCVISMGLRPHWHVFENLSGVGGMLMGLSILNAASIGWATKLAKLTYGMYLCHLLFLGFFRTVWHKVFGHADNYHFAVIAACLTLTASAFTSAILSRSRWLKILVPA